MPWSAWALSRVKPSRQPSTTTQVWGIWVTTSSWDTWAGLTQVKVDRHHQASSNIATSIKTRTMETSPKNSKHRSNKRMVITVTLGIEVMAPTKAKETASKAVASAHLSSTQLPRLHLRCLQQARVATTTTGLPITTPVAQWATPCLPILATVITTTLVRCQTIRHIIDLFSTLLI